VGGLPVHPVERESMSTSSNLEQIRKDALEYWAMGEMKPVRGSFFCDSKGCCLLGACYLLHHPQYDPRKDGRHARRVKEWVMKHYQISSWDTDDIMDGFDHRSKRSDSPAYEMASQVSRILLPD
jgi:hypothetical protein